MKMRKWYIALLMLLAFTACQQEPVLPEGGMGGGNSFDPSKLRFNLTIEHPDGAATKGVKKGWKNGDKVFLFINGITTGYLTATLTYNPGETPWTATYYGTDLASLGDSGTLQAVYLPYGSDATPSYSAGQWSFSGGTGGTDTYYFYASDVDYEVNEDVLSATIQMVKPTDYVQLFIPRESASGTIQLACNGLRPAGFASIAAADGAVTESPLGAAGTAVHGYPDTLEGEEGYYVSGKQTSVTNNDYYFALTKSDGSYAHYFKHRTQAMADNGAYQLPAYSSWPTVGSSRSVLIGGNKWNTVNEGASHPWTMGNLTPSFDPGDGKGLPTVANWDSLLDANVASWKEMDIMGQKGYLVVSVDNPSTYIFLPWSTSSATDYWIDPFNKVFRIATDGTKTNEVTPAPAQAYARLVEKLNYFKIRAKNDGTTITSFKYTDGTIQYSVDRGGSWQQYTGQAFPTLNADDEVWFKNSGVGNRPDCNCQGNTQLFTADNVCYIAGDITSLLSTPSPLPANAFRSAFSYGNTTDNNAENLEKQLPVASGTVDWVDIDPGDPLILPASTAANCYMEMFMGCTNLTSAPALPATILEDKCYFRMFYGCSSLTSIPTFPSVAVTWNGTSNRQRYCFQMFQACTRITTLTGALFGGTMTLAPNCFEDMFAHCTGLTSISQGFLPATTLARHCYRGMFQDTRFQRAPDLLATTLVEYCYRYMFNGCSRLNYIKCLATNPYSSNNNNAFTRDWVGSVANSGTFIKNNDEEMHSSWATGQVYGIPSGWTAYQVKDEPTP